MEGSEGQKEKRMIYFGVEHTVERLPDYLKVLKFWKTPFLAIIQIIPDSFYLSHIISQKGHKSR